MTGPWVAKEWVMVTLEVWSLPRFELRITSCGKPSCATDLEAWPRFAWLGLSFFFGDTDLVARPGSVYTFWWSFRTHCGLPLNLLVFGPRSYFASTDSLLGWRSWVHGSSREVWEAFAACSAARVIFKNIHIIVQRSLSVTLKSKQGTRLTLN